MEVKLTRNGWHRKIQCYVFKNPPLFNNLCPYFWLTNFCILFTFIIPIVPLFKSLGWLGKQYGKMCEAIARTLNNNICLPKLVEKAKKMNDDEIIKGWALFTNDNLYAVDMSERRDVYFFLDEYYGSSAWTYNKKVKKSLKEQFKVKKSLKEQFEAWKNLNPDHEVILAKIRERYKAGYAQVLLERQKIREQLEKIQAEEAAKEQRKKYKRDRMFMFIIKYTKWLLLPIGLYLLYIVGKYVWKGLDYGIAHFNYNNFILIIQVVGVCVAIGITVTGLIYLLKAIIMKGINCLVQTKMFTPIIAILAWLGIKLILPVMNAIGTFCVFFWQYLMAAKKDYCPGISWNDKPKK